MMIKRSMIKSIKEGDRSACEQWKSGGIRNSRAGIRTQVPGAKTLDP